MITDNIINILQYRGFVLKITHEKDLLKITQQKKIALYCGFDPTADSLHVGHLLPLLCLKHFQLLGHKPIVLIGQATSLIGDPSFKKKERFKLTNHNINKWIEKITNQISLFLDFNSKNKAIIVNNYDWFKKINVINFLNNIGQYFSVNTMIHKASVRERIHRNEESMSFTEFSYSLLQAYDFSFLHNKYNVMLQIGGSDQWGNIVSGINLTKKLYNKQVFGLTIPLLTQVNGSKFGKTEKGTIWLDNRKTSVFNFYQFWINIPDSEAINYLKMFTLLSVKEIKEIELNSKEKIDLHNVRKMLANKITYLVHGEEGLAIAKRITDYLFSENVNNIKLLDFQQLIKDGIHFLKLKGTENIQDILVLSRFAESKSQAKNIICSRGIRVNHKILLNWKYQFKDTDKLFMKYTLISRGKKNHCLLCW